MGGIEERGTRIFFLLVVFSIAVRVVLIATTYGTNDVGFMAASVALVEKVGIARAYSHTAMMNHPPLSFAVMRGLDRISESTQIAFPDVFRGFQVLCDLLTGMALLFIGRRLGGEGAGRRYALFFLLSPGAAFLSAFHCNTDATMTALLISAVAFALYGAPVAAGATLAVAGGIKIVAFLSVPLFFLYFFGRARTLFLAAFAVVAAVLFVPAIVAGGPAVVRVVFGYSGGLPYEWGLTGVAFAISRNVRSMYEAGEAAMQFYVRYGRYFVFAGIGAVLLGAFRKRPLWAPSLPHAIAIMHLTLLALAPGFGVQYVQWLIAFLPFALSWRAAIAVNASISLFLFITYTVWSGGWPWWFADVARRSPHRYVAALAGYAMWAIVCVALVAAVRRFRAEPRSEPGG